MGYDKNKDYSIILDYLIKGGASKEDVKKVLDERNHKIDKDENLEKYRYDENAKKALDYINKPDLKEDKKEVIDNYNDAIDKATNKKINGIKDEIGSLENLYDEQKSKIYRNARLSAIGNNEKLAQQGLSKGLYDIPSSGYGEIARANLDAALQNNINSAESQKQKKISELNQKIREALDDGEYKKAQNLVDTAYKYDFEINEQYNNDRDYEFEKNKEAYKNEKDKINFLEAQKQKEFENKIALEKLELEKSLNAGRISKTEYENKLSKLKIQEQELKNNNISNNFKDSNEYKDIMAKVLSGNYSLSYIVEKYMPVLKKYNSDALLEIADAYYSVQKNK